MPSQLAHAGEDGGSEFRVGMAPAAKVSDDGPVRVRQHRTQRYVISVDIGHDPELHTASLGKAVASGQPPSGTATTANWVCQRRPSRTERAASHRPKAIQIPASPRPWKARTSAATGT
jgi:hypothetical protein